MAPTRFLVLGDLHLGEDGFEVEPQSEWQRYDAILTVGDIAHASASLDDGTPIREDIVGLAEAEQFFDQLDDLGVPVLSVPGNHDHDCHEALVSTRSNVRNLHRRTTQLDGYRVFGFGSEAFDDGPEIRLDPASLSDVGDVDAWLESTLRERYRGESDAATAGRVDQLDGFEEGFDTYVERYESIRSLCAEEGSAAGVVGLVHVPPFNTRIDRLAADVPTIGGRHWGSIAVKHALLDTAVTFLACGHVHGSPGRATVAGTTCLNVGYHGCHEVELSPDGESVTAAPLDTGRT